MPMHYCYFRIRILFLTLKIDNKVTISVTKRHSTLARKYINGSGAYLLHHLRYGYKFYLKSDIFTTENISYE